MKQTRRDGQTGSGKHKVLWTGLLLGLAWLLVSCIGPGLEPPLGESTRDQGPNVTAGQSGGFGNGVLGGSGGLSGGTAGETATDGQGPADGGVALDDDAGTE